MASRHPSLLSPLSLLALLAFFLALPLAHCGPTLDGGDLLTSEAPVSEGGQLEGVIVETSKAHEAEEQRRETAQARERTRDVESAGAKDDGVRSESVRKATDEADAPAAQSDVGAVDPALSLSPPAEAAAPSSGAAADRSAGGRPATAARMRLGVALRAARPWSFPASLTPVLYGAALAFKVEDTFSPLVLVLSALTAVAVHAAGNLVNTYVDHRNGVDLPTTSDQTLVAGALREAQVRTLIGGAYGAGLVFGAPLLLASRAPALSVLAALCLGGLSSYTYTAGPGLKYRALGDVLIMSTFGPLLVSFSYLVQSGVASWLPVVASLPLALHSGAILHANNARDADDDRKAGVRTLAQAMTPGHSTAFYGGALLAPFLVATLRALGTSAIEALPLALLPVAVRLLRTFQNGMRRAADGVPLVEALVDMPKRTAKLQAGFALLAAAGMLLPAPPLGRTLGSIGRTLLRCFYDRAHP